MLKYKFTTAITLIIIATFVFSGCPLPGPGSDGPDLVPERRPGSQGAEGFCMRDEEGLTIKVRNQGNRDVIENFTTIVEFSPGGPRSESTASMPAGSFSEVKFEIPPGCFNPDCDFTITVDANTDIEETNENNNTVSGICIG